MNSRYRSMSLATISCKAWMIGMSFLWLINGCTAPPPAAAGLDYAVDTTGIPADTIAFTHPGLTYSNGEYFFENKLYSGMVYKVLKGYSIATYSSVLNGRLHGTYRSFYASGKPYEIRQYRKGLSVGKHLGYWEDSGNLKFEYHYYDQKKEGSQKSWYANGNLAYAYMYSNDQLEGLQQAWRENGSLYRNFVVKNGISYGLQKSKSCYEVIDEEVVRQADKNEL